MKSGNFNIANQITFFRLLIIPVFLIFLFINKPYSNIVAAIIFIVASLSDFIDGYIARKYDLVTNLGKIADPVADKILVASAMVALVELQRIPSWVVIVILAREFAVGALRNFASTNGVIIPAGWSGKIKTTIQLISLTMIIFKEKFLGVNMYLIGKVLLYISVVVSILSLVDYFYRYFKKGNPQ
ncbi:CDP-diacylglycerol--glycerol-3-phosphate 3-phosphatidyltransferase [Deferribacter autotrophicus]|uniref:CDP-diacylglycerol--glycerol-3-phosphate 3-phosphatidyltransferase n=1 Tax=Deferribacter autotrophicus TaxID=500465 RepID=A0A5A8F7K3_9BACT|nr:CDP-diacylglycerol--glycerol-3-phosphate 3-phosphatidyltransferase [Deferribacter autotrophicus]KAA0259583.1 CDP-diacylglycerol--glycerol-3-phosphate 3-phosphatidyltransferase [Deferribacter autotrophicus]